MSADPYDDEYEEDDEWGNVNCQPVFIDEDSDDDPAQANGDAEPSGTWRDWT